MFARPAAASSDLSGDVPGDGIPALASEKC